MGEVAGAIQITLRNTTFLGWRGGQITPSDHTPKYDFLGWRWRGPCDATSWVEVEGGGGDSNHTLQNATWVDVEGAIRLVIQIGRGPSHTCSAAPAHSQV